nr:MAG TPA: hypothetical protein [Caudoviricetes sp.]
MLKYILRWLFIIIMFVFNTSMLYYSLYVTKRRILKVILIFLYIVIIVIISLFIIYQLLVRKYM